MDADAIHERRVRFEYVPGLRDELPTPRFDHGGKSGHADHNTGSELLPLNGVRTVGVFGCAGIQAHPALPFPRFGRHLKFTTQFWNRVVSCTGLMLV